MGHGIADYASKLGTLVAGAYDMGAQVWIQCQAVIVTLAWSSIGATILYVAIDRLWGFRPSLETEHEGLDIAEHGERAYHY